MAKIVLISCVSMKLEGKAKARDLYVSPLFKMNMKYAESMKPDRIFILSAKYGLLDIDREVDTYDQTLNKMSVAKLKVWSEEVVKRLHAVSDLENDEFVLLAGDKYRKFIVPELKNYDVPMKGLGIGKQLKFLKERVG